MMRILSGGQKSIELCLQHVGIDVLLSSCHAKTDQEQKIVN